MNGIVKILKTMIDFEDFKNELISLVLICIGSTVAAFALEEFLVPNTILDGGVTGVSMILNKLTGVSLSIFVFCLNLPFLFVGFKQLGRRFFVKAIVAMILFSVLLNVFRDAPDITHDELLATIFGGLMLGVGVGTVLRYGGCLDGTETVAILISKKTSFSVGQVVFVINIVIYCVAGFLFGADRAMYSLLTYFITFKVIDLVEVGMEQGKSVMIITDEGKQMADCIYKRLGRTVTMMDGSGLISGKKVVLYCVVTRIEVHEIKRIVKEADYSAFVTISDVAEIVGKHIKKNDGSF